ncbi:MAG: hypothetical protein ACFB02_11870 [Mastigocoleus sp.]
MKYRNKLNQLLDKNLIINLAVSRLGLNNYIKTDSDKSFNQDSNLDKSSSCMSSNTSFTQGLEFETLSDDTTLSSRTHSLSNTEESTVQVIIFHLENAVLSIKASESSATSSQKKRYLAQTIFHLHEANNNLSNLGKCDLQSDINQIIQSIHTPDNVEKIYQKKHDGSFSNYLEEINRILIAIDSSIDSFDETFDKTVVTNISYDNFLSRQSYFSAKEVSF